MKLLIDGTPKEVAELVVSLRDLQVSVPSKVLASTIQDILNPPPEQDQE